MATKPTRQQDQACDALARAYLEVAQAARLDGRSDFGRAEFAEVVRLAARASSAFTPDAIFLRALGSRVRSLGLRSDAVELLTLVDESVDPVAALLLDDESFRALVARAEEELGEA